MSRRRSTGANPVQCRSVRIQEAAQEPPPDGPETPVQPNASQDCSNGTDELKASQPSGELSEDEFSATVKEVAKTLAAM